MGTPADGRSANNVLAMLDIGCTKRAHFADYVVGMFLAGRSKELNAAARSEPRGPLQPFV